MIAALNALFFATFAVLAATGLVMYHFGELGGLFLVAAAVMVCIFLLPFVLKVVPMDPFSPLALAAGALLLGTGFRVPYVLFSDEARAEFLMFGSQFFDIADHVIVMCIGALFFVIGYCTVNRRLSISAIPLARHDIAPTRNVIIFSAVFAVIGAVSAMIFIRASGIDLSGGLAAASRKVFVAHVVDNGATVAGTGGLPRFMVKFAEIPFILLFALVIVRRLKLSPFIVGLLLCLAVPVFMTPFLTSSRSTIVLVLIKLGIIAYYFDRLNMRHILAGVAVIVVIVTAMGNLRSQNMAGIDHGRSVVGTIVGSGNGLDIVRTAGIMERVPEVTPHLYGQSYLSLAVFYIPRSIWPNKPDVALGPWVKETVFGHPVPGNNGWPAGMIAEAYINFGAVGVPVVMLLFGMFLRIIYNSFRPYLGVSIAMTALYALFAWRLGFGMIGLNFAHSMSQILIALFPAILFFLVCEVRFVQRNRPMNFRPILRKA